MDPKHPRFQNTAEDLETVHEERISARQDADQTKCANCDQIMADHPVSKTTHVDKGGTVTDRTFYCEGFVDPDVGEEDEPETESCLRRETMLDKRRREIERVQPAFQAGWILYYLSQAPVSRNRYFGGRLEW